MNKEYKPIACGLYDELELRALRKIKVKIVFINDKNETDMIESIIIDLFSKDKVEYLKTDGGKIIRLDDVIELDNILFNKSC
ncbi:MAG TPA: hypothetical protein PKE38_02190 [Ignavibacteriaceae bacterium]|nr:hypothetical protein [Ignavibacteriaceae bacterium]